MRRGGSLCCSARVSLPPPPGTSDGARKGHKENPAVCLGVCAEAVASLVLWVPAGGLVPTAFVRAKLAKM